MDMKYTFDGLGFPGITPGDQQNISMDGDNSMRLTIGAAFRVAVLVLNADFSLGSQNALVAGINF